MDSSSGSHRPGGPAPRDRIRKRRRHAAERSRVVAGALSFAAFIGLGTNIALRAGAATTAVKATSGSSSATTTGQASTSSSSSSSTSSSSSWAATAAQSSSGRQAVTTSHGS